MDSTINQLVSFCDKNYNRRGNDDDKCTNCPNETCYKSCLACLEQIHNIDCHNRTYNCQNIAYCYTCKYIYRYLSEIEHILTVYLKEFNEVNRLNVCSIGCGPCSELFGLYDFKIKNKLKYEIKFLGFEENLIWKPIHDEINSLSESKFESQFIYSDVFDYYDKNSDLPNIVILNYVLSDILRKSADDLQQFLNKFYEFYSLLPNSILIINDINLGTDKQGIRAYYDPLIKKIKERNNIEVGKFHFRNSQKDYYRYGEQHPQNTVFINPIAEINEYYSPWLECRSAQCIIYKKAI